MDDNFQSVIDKGIEYDPHVFIKVAHSSDSADEFNDKLDEFIDDVGDNSINGEMLAFYLKGTDLSIDTKDDDKYDVRWYIILSGTGKEYSISKH